MTNHIHPFAKSACVAVAFLTSAISVSAQEPKISSVQRIGNDVELVFTGSAGVIYSVQQSPGLVDNTWRPLGLEVTGTGAAQTLLVAGAGTAGTNFLRLSYNLESALSGYIRIPSGTFLMGDQNVPFEGLMKERPVLSVPTGSFLMKTTEVSKAEWDVTFTWAVANGYTFSNQSGVGKGPEYPVTFVNWYDIVKWCNAKSEQEGLQPCYTFLVGPREHEVYRSGQVSKVIWNFTADGYRLPCEAEWEKAARGGVVGRRFPSGTTINHSGANYFASKTTYDYDTAGVDGHHPAYNTGTVLPYTSPVASFPANPYGLYDMEANVREYCWDTSTSDYSEGYIVKSESSSSLFPRAVRGGDWSNTAITCRCSYRSQQFPDTGKNNYTGFRLVKGPLN